MCGATIVTSSRFKTSCDELHVVLEVHLNRPDSLQQCHSGLTDRLSRGRVGNRHDHLSMNFRCVVVERNQIANDRPVH
jgi:hypothetical protein